MTDDVLKAKSYDAMLEWEVFCSVISCTLAPSLVLIREDHAMQNTNAALLLLLLQTMSAL